MVNLPDARLSAAAIQARWRSSTVRRMPVSMAISAKSAV
jgi:hypothetical protein